MTEQSWIIFAGAIPAVLVVLIQAVFAEISVRRARHDSSKEAAAKLRYELALEDTKPIIEWLDALAGLVHYIGLMTIPDIRNNEEKLYDQKTLKQRALDLHQQESILMPSALWRARSLSPEIAKLCDDVQHLGALILDGQNSVNEVPTSYQQWQTLAGELRSAIRNYLVQVQLKSKH